MLDLVIIFFVIYAIYKKYNSGVSQNFISNLQKKGFGNIAYLQQNPTSTFIKADFHGENYLFCMPKNTNIISQTMVNVFVEYAAKNHFHKLVLVAGNAKISDTAKKVISDYEIEIWNAAKLNELAQQDYVIQKNKTDDTCPIEESVDPIQDGTKANSIWSSLFENKIEKL